jgi:hypothetical protein
VKGNSDAATELPLGEKSTRLAPSPPGQRPIAPLPTVDQVDQLPVAELSAFIAECCALQARAWARLGPSASEQADEDGAGASEERRVRAPEAAKIIDCSVRWLRQHGHKLPSFRRDLNGRRVTGLPSALLAWMRKAGSC